MVLLEIIAVLPASFVQTPEPTVSGDAPKEALLSHTSKSSFTTSGEGMSLVIFNSSKAVQPPLVTVQRKLLIVLLSASPVTVEL